jgi:Calcineurin-like phosphoesterase
MGARLPSIPAAKDLASPAMPVSRAFRADSSRTSRAAAGWDRAGDPVGEFVEKSKTATFHRQFNWLQPKVLLESRNDILAKLVAAAKTDLVNDERMRWVAAQRAAGIDTDFVVDRTDLGERFSFLVVGDPGEGDASQYAVAPHLLDEEQPDTSFALIVSDVVYPTGENNDYADSFYRPYRKFDKPIYALPGNHDWYSLLTGFMWNFCGAEPPPTPTERLASYSWQERLARFLWLRPKQPERELLMSYRDERWRMGRPDGHPLEPHQRGPYFAIKTRSLLLVCIDTGTSGTLDREQGEWLLRMARLDEPKQKILFTGKPLRVDGDAPECKIKWLPEFNPDKDPTRTGSPEPFKTKDEPDPPSFAQVDSIFRDSEFGFIASVGGDVHNYQRYPGAVQYIVSGGGGAFMSPTHTIEDLGAAEAEFRCYPLRRDSLARFAQGSAQGLRARIFWIALASLLLWWLALQAWNPHNAELDDPQLGPLTLAPMGDLIRNLNVSPGTDVGVFAPLAWFFPGADYSWWAAVVVGAVSLAIGLLLLVLPWFRWRVKGVITLAAGGAALLAWHGTFMDVPGATYTFIGVGLVGGCGIFLLSRDFAREANLWLRRAVIVLLLLGAAVAADWNPFEWGRWGFIPIVLALSAAAVVLVGGPRLTWKEGLAAGAAIGLLTLILSSIHAGLGWVTIATVACALSLYAIYATALLFRVLFWLKPLDPDVAASVLLVDKGAHVRPVPSGLDPGRFPRAGRWGLLRSRWTRPLYPLEVVYSAVFDHNQQPLFKNFLRVDVDGDRVKIYCFGIAEENEAPTVEDHVQWDGTSWTDARAILGEGATSPVLGEVDWYPGPDVRFHLDAEERARFTVLSSDGDGWSRVGELEYLGPDSRCDLDDPGVTRPHRIGLRRVGEGEEGPLFAEGTFV